jgi:hypothetical protein
VLKKVFLAVAARGLSSAFLFGVSNSFEK